jgi:hypothetical protein
LSWVLDKGSSGVTVATDEVGSVTGSFNNFVKSTPTIRKFSDTRNQGSRRWRASRNRKGKAVVGNVIATGVDMIAETRRKGTEGWEAGYAGGGKRPT